MREPRLGDDIDDFCVRCKRVMNHAIVSVVSGEPAKVRCRTCHNDHDFRHEQAPPPKVDLRKQALFNEALKRIDPSAAPVEATLAEAEIVDISELAADEEVPVLDAKSDVDSEPLAEPEPLPTPRKAAAKAARPRGRKSAK